MAHTVFISYDNPDRAAAQRVCAALEQAHIGCWIAPRNSDGGSPPAQAILDAIASSRVLVLVFSSASNASPQVCLEVEQAVREEIPILPFRIEGVCPTGPLEPFLDARRWLDASPEPTVEHLQQLVHAVGEQLLLKRVQAGDAEAVAQLFERYSRRLARLAEQHLSRRLGGRLDGEDVVQSVFRTFFRRSAQGGFQIDSSAQLWELLVKITVRKAQAKGRSHTAGMRDVGAEMAGGGDARLPEAIALEPGPAEAVELLDQIEALRRDLPPLCGPVLEMRLQGYGVSEIAAMSGVTRRTVQRALNRLQKRLEEAASDGPA